MDFFDMFRRWANLTRANPGFSNQAQTLTRAPSDDGCGFADGSGAYGGLGANPSREALPSTLAKRDPRKAYGSLTQNGLTLAALGSAPDMPAPAPMPGAPPPHAGAFVSLLDAIFPQKPGDRRRPFPPVG